MLLRKRQKEALAMFGNQEALDRLIEMGIFKSVGINIDRQDYATTDEIILALESRKVPSYILISSDCFSGQRNGKERAIEEIRKVSSDVEIIFFMSEEEREEKFVSFAYGYGVYHIYYAKGGSFDFERIIEDITENKTASLEKKEIEEEKEEIEKEWLAIKEKEKRLKEEEQKSSLERENKAEKEKKEAEIVLKREIEKAKNESEEAKRKIKELEEKHEKEIENIRLERERKEKELEYNRKQKEIERINKENSFGGVYFGTGLTQSAITIGVFSLSRGAGSTTTALNIAKYLSEQGFPTCVLAMDNSKDLLMVKSNKYHIYIPESEIEKERAYTELQSKGYKFIILDYGCVFDLDRLGNEREENSRTDDIKRLVRTNYRVGVGFSSLWHIGKLNRYINDKGFDNDSTIFAIEDIEGKRELQVCPLQICDRGSDWINEVLLKMMGIA